MAYAIHNTKKLYFGTYPYKISLSFKPAIGFNNFTNKRNLIKSWVEKHYGIKHNDKWKKNWCIRLTESYYSFNFYARTKDDADKIIKKFSNDISGYERPENEEHLNILLQEEKIIIKDYLYHNLYRYRFQCKNRNKEDWSEIYEWISEYGKNAGWTNDDWDFTWSSGSLYIRDVNQLLIVRLALNHKINYLEKVVLKSEI